MKKKHSREFKKGIAFGAGFVLVVMLVAFALSKIEIVAGHQTYDGDDIEMSHMGSGCSGMHGGMNKMASMSIEEMDEDGDSLCDMCNMPIEQCKEMQHSGKRMMHMSGCSAMHEGMKIE